jgi:AAA+ ATPase superfamily predicted ATPase
MESLQFHQSPLFGRLTGQWHLQSLPFATLKEFFPDWTAEERVAAYAMVGGVPAYLNWLNPKFSLIENIQKVILAEGSMFLSEPTFLLYDEVREPQSYLAVLKSIGLGNHTLSEISQQALISTNHLSSYLIRLQDLKMIERRLPATVSPAKRRRSRRGRYHIKDPYFRFYFRFIAPFYEYLPFDIEKVLQKVRQELRAFVGQTIFEELSRQWVIEQGRAGNLPFTPEIVGSHWSKRVQIDVVGVNWSERQILLGECKWGGQVVNRQVVRELIEQKTPRLKNDLPDMGQGWQVHYAFFSRAGFTVSALKELRAQNGLAVDLPKLDNDLT